MALSSADCRAFNDYLGRRPYNWDKKIAKDRKPHEFIYAGMYKSSKWPSFTGTNHLHEKVYVARVNDPGMWPQYFADPCLGQPCDMTVSYIGHGVDQLSFGRFRKEVRSSVFCLDQLNTIEEAPAKLDAIVSGYKQVPEDMLGQFTRQLALREAGTASQGAGLWLVGVQDAYGNPSSIDMADNMFAVNTSAGNKAGTANGLFLNLNANGQLTTLANAGKITSATTPGLVPFLSQLTMEYLGNHQEDLAMQGYHDGDSDLAGKFNITMDESTSRRLLVANPELRGLYKAADFQKAGAFYSYGMSAGCGDWLFKRDPQQWRFDFRADLDGLDLNGNVLAGAVWLEQIQPYENVAATFGIKPQYSSRWKAAPVRIYHCYNREAREMFMGDITSVNSEMKFGLARSFAGNMKWMHPSFFRAFDPNTGSVCDIENVKDNKGFFLGEYDVGLKTVYPEIERWFLALGEATPYTRRPNTVTPATAPVSSQDYQALLAYNGHCGDALDASPQIWGETPFARAVESDGDPITGPTSAQQGGANFVGYQVGYVGGTQTYQWGGIQPV
jgi:hypothetical protein